MNGTHETEQESETPARRKRRPALKPTATDLPTAQKRFAKLVKQRSKLQAKLAKVSESLDIAEADVIKLTKAAAK